MLTNSFCWYFLSICLSCPPNPPQVCWYKSVVEAADLLSSLPQAPVSTDGYLLRSFSGVTLSNSLWNGQRNFFQLFPSLKKKITQNIPPTSKFYLLISTPMLNLHTLDPFTPIWVSQPSFTLTALTTLGRVCAWLPITSLHLQPLPRLPSVFAALSTCLWHFSLYHSATTLDSAVLNISNS